VLEIETPFGLARAHWHPAPEARAALMLGHGAGGGIQAPDLVAATEAAVAVGVSVALVEQPYRVAGRRSAAPARQLDTAWLAVVESLRGSVIGSLPLFVGGRSSGARVACRTASVASAAGAVCLAFPLHPPGKGDDPSKSRLGELEEVSSVPVLVVQGERDPFGMPPAASNRSVVVVPGDHSLRSRGPVGEAVASWFAVVLAAL
jgi:uncharacterized protein